MKLPCLPACRSCCTSSTCCCNCNCCSCSCSCSFCCCCRTRTRQDNWQATAAGQVNLLPAAHMSSLYISLLRPNMSSLLCQSLSCLSTLPFSATHLRLFYHFLSLFLSLSNVANCALVIFIQSCCCRCCCCHC